MFVHRFFMTILLASVTLIVYGVDAGTFIRGIVRDSLTTEGLPFASIRIEGGKKTTVTDSHGIFELTLPANSKTITASCQGYKSATIALHDGSIQLYDILLSHEATQLKEVVIKKQKYSKKNNPAVEFARRLRRMGEVNNPRRNDWYSYRTYERMSMGINNFDTTQSNSLMRRIPNIAEHIDTSEISGCPVLNMLVKEKAADVYFRRSPQAERTIVKGIRSEGIDEVFDQNNAYTVMAEMLRPVDLYQGDINLLRNNFVSPLSAIAADYYRFYLVDSAAVIPGSKEPHIALAFYPRNKSNIGFQGHIYVPAADTAMHVARVELGVSSEINLNFVKSLRLVQNYSQAPDGSRLINDDWLMMELEIMPGTPQLYLTRKINYQDHTFEQPEESDSIFAGLGDLHTLSTADKRDEAFWAEARSIPLSPGEDKADLLMERLRRQKLFYYGEIFLRNMVQGYWPTSSKSKFDIGPLNTMASYNSFEGLRLRAGGMTTANLNPNLFGRGYVAYGFGDKRWKYQIQGEYSFIKKKYHPREFPMHSLRFTHEYDIDRLGSHYLYTNSDNFVLSLSRMSDRRFTYRRLSQLQYTLELENHLSLTASFEHIWQQATPLVPFVDASGFTRNHFGMPIWNVSLRYAPGETFYQAKSYRIPIDETVPVFEIRHRWSPKGLWGNDFGVNRTEVAVSKRFRMSFLGALDARVSAGHTWGQSVFTELFIPNANLSYIIQPGSFALMNPMEFVNSSYVSWHLTYEMRGLLLNYIPGVRRLGLREIVGFSGIYGSLSQKNTPSDENNLLLFPKEAAVVAMNKPYMEFSVGLDNIFRFIRLDYVWRLNYLDVPYEIDSSGLRIAMNFTF